MDSIVYAADAGVEFFHFRRLTRRFPPHFHKTWLIGCLVAGKRYLYVGANKLAICPGDLVIIPPCAAHACASASAEATEWICGHIPPRLLEFLPASHFCLRYPGLTAGFRTVAADAFANGRLPVQAWHNFIAALGRLAPDKPVSANEESDLFAYACAQMEEEPARKLPLWQLAQSCGLGKSNFLRSFKKANRITPGRYLTSMRVLKAQQLLTNGMDLAQCAIYCGFYDQSHFSRIFKANLGITPGNYRAALAKGGAKC